MNNEPSEADLDAYESARAATKIPVIVAPGPLPASKRDSIGGASRAVLFWVDLAGDRRIVVEDDEGPLAEVTAARFASATMHTKFMDPNATVELWAKSEDPANTARECLIIAGPKRELRQAFAFIGQHL